MLKYLKFDKIVGYVLSLILINMLISYTEELYLYSVYSVLLSILYLLFTHNINSYLYIETINLIISLEKLILVKIYALNCLYYSINILRLNKVFDILLEHWSKIILKKNRSIKLYYRNNLDYFYNNLANLHGRV